METNASDHFGKDRQATVAGRSAKAAARSRDLFNTGLYCAESVLQAVADNHGCSDPNIYRMATGFCGGIARTAGMCGALAGGIMAMGLFTGRRRPTESKDQCYSLVHELVQRFQTKFGSTQCTDLLGCNIATAEGARQFMETNLEITVCAEVTSLTAGLVEDVYARRATLRHPLL